mgnify:CR=1 FL=1
MDQIATPTQRAIDRTTRVATCAALLALALPAASASEVLLLNVFTSTESFSYTVPTKKATQLPKWSPAQENPPLDIGRAIKIAVDAQAGSKPNGTKALLQEVKLSRTASSEVALVWFYQVSLKPTGQLPENSNSTTIILMEGTIVTPIVQKVPAR